ncbi:MAG: histidine triad nucleotide-binding protein [Armatimonadota bacterium]
MTEDCLFCRIAAGEIESEIVHEDEQCVAFRDINPQAPTHILVIPRRHIAGIAEAREDDQDLLGHLLLTVADVARHEGIADSGYRTVINWGADGGMEVPHLHIHVLGGRAMSWPPG